MKSELLANELFLKTLLQHVKMFNQWHSIHNHMKAYSSLIKIETLLHMIEIEDCKSIGGFSKNQGENSQNFGKRVKFLLDKNNIELSTIDKGFLKYLIKNTCKNI